MFRLIAIYVFLNVTTPVEVIAKVYVILDHPKYMFNLGLTVSFSPSSGILNTARESNALLSEPQREKTNNMDSDQV